MLRSLRSPRLARYRKSTVARVAVVALVLGAVGLGGAAAESAAPGLGGVVTNVEGEPLAGITVELYGTKANGGSWYGAVTTDAAGHYEFRVGETASPYSGLFAAGVYSLSASPAYDGPLDGVYEYFSWGSEFTVRDSFATASFTMHRLAAVAGTVSDETGDPVVADVSILGADGWDVGMGTSGDDGSYRVVAWETGPARIGFATSSGFSLYVPQYFDGVATYAEATVLTLEQDVTATGIDAVLHRGAVVAGTVSRPDGGDLGDVEIVVFDDDNPDVVARTAFTDPDGSFAVPGLLPGSYRVAAIEQFGEWTPGFDYSRIDWYYGTGRIAPASPNLTVTASGVTGIEIVMAGTTSATITPSAADPASGMIVLGNTRGTEATSFEVAFDETTHAYPVAAGATFDVPFGRLAGGTEVVVSEGGVPLAGYLVPTSSIAGQVTDVSGAPIEMVQVQAQPVGAGYPRSGWTGEDGTYSIGGLNPGDYVVEFIPEDGDGARQYYQGVSDIADAQVLTIAPEATYLTGIDAQIRPGGAITGAVLTVEGVPAVGAAVRLYKAENLASSIRETTVAADGSYSFTGLSTNNYAIRVGTGESFAVPRWFGPSGTEVDANVIALGTDAVFEDADVTVELGGVLSGLLADAAGGDAWVSSWVTVYGPSGAQVASLYAWASLPRAWSTEALPAGEYRVKFEAVGRTAWWDGADSFEEATPIDLAVGATEHADYTFPLEGGGSISGTVTYAATGAPAGYADVTVYRVTTGEWGPWNTSVTTRTTAADGTYEVTGLTAGDYQVRISRARQDGVELPPQWYETGWTTGDMHPTVVLATDTSVVSGIDLALQPGILVSGRVIDASSGAPLAGAYISSGYTYVYTSADGSFTLSVPPGGGEYQLSVSSTGYLAQSRTLVVPASGLGDVEVQLVAGETVSGRVTAANNGVPLQNIAVRLYDARRSVYVYTDSTGRYTTEAVLPGVYKVEFSNSGGMYVTQWYDGSLTSDGATPLVVGADGAVGVDAALTLGGVLEGVVQDSAGDPLSGATVGLAVQAGTDPISAGGLRAAASGDLGHLVPGATATTDSTGHYDLPSMPPGTYALFVYRPDLGTTWYDGRRTLEDADPIVVQASRTITVSLTVLPLADGEVPRTPEETLTTSFAITRQPADLTVQAGESGSFSVAAAGTPVPTVQWEQRLPDEEWVAIDGATAPELDVWDATLAESGTQYRAVFTQGVATLVTDPATLTVTEAPAVPGAPAVPTVTEIGETGATVGWTAPADNRSAITGYEVRLYEADALEPARTVVTGLVTSLRFDGLDPASPYRATVAAINAVGTGPASTEATFATADAVTVPLAPGRPSASAASATSASVSWAAPSDDGGSAITVYTVRTYAGATELVSSRATSATTSVLVTGLSPETDYTFAVTATNGIGDGPESAHSDTVRTHAVVIDPGDSVTLQTPVRALADWSVPPSTVRCTQVSGTAGVPDDATGVIMNVTTVRPNGPGYVVVYPDTAGNGATPAPGGSTVNFEPGADVANSAFVALPANGKVCYYTRGASSVGVLLDVTGYTLDGSGIVMQASTRLLDTRPGGEHVGEVTGPVAPRQTYTVQVAGVAGVPADAAAVLLNVTVTGVTTIGNLRVFPGGQAVPNTSVINFAAGQAKANATIVALVDGKVSFYSDSPASVAVSPVQVILDVVGYVQADSAYTGVSPTRVMDTRPGSRVGPIGGSLAARTVYSLPLAGVGPVPVGATAVVLNVTAIGPSGNGNLRVYPDSDGTGLTAPPNASAINYIPGRDIPNQVVVALPANGRVNFYSDMGGGTVHLAADVVGYITAVPDRR